MDRPGPLGTDETLAGEASHAGEAPTLAGEGFDATLASGGPSAPSRAGVPDRVGRFEILERLGQGGMGVVYRARDPDLAREVAIKLLRAGRDPAHSARLQREAQAMARVQHPNLVTVFDVGRVDDEVFVAMEYVRGSTLREWLALRPRSPDEILRAFVQAGRGLIAAHGAGIVHRDFKPDNVLVADTGVVKVLDFGLAVGAADEPAPVTPTSPVGPEDPMALRLTQTGALLGTPAYMSPEQFRGDKTDARTDQFSFAVALWEALDGRRPFAGESLGELCTNVLAGNLRPGRFEHATAALEPALRRALEVDRDRRWPTLEALIDALERDIGRDPASERTSAARAKRRLVAPLAIGALAAVSIGLFAVQSRRPAAIDPATEDATAQVSEADPRLLEIADPEAEPARRKQLATEYLQAHGGTGPVAGRIIAEAALGTILWAESCKSAIQAHGLCARIEPVAADARRCVGDAERLVAHDRDWALRDQALEHLRAADRLIDGAERSGDPRLAEAMTTLAAEARIALADDEVEQLLRLQLSTDVDDSDDAELDARRREVFAAFAFQLNERAWAAERIYKSVDAHGSNAQIARAASRLGRAAELYPQKLRDIPVPLARASTIAREWLEIFMGPGRQAEEDLDYCDTIDNLARAPQRLAADAYRKCVERADSGPVPDDVAQGCRQRLAVLESELGVPLKAAITGALSKDEIRAVVRTNIADIRDCYNDALRDNPELGGRVAVEFTIGGDGHVIATSVRNSTMPDKRLNACVGSKTMLWIFPEPSDGGEVKVVYPFDLSAG